MIGALSIENILMKKILVCYEYFAPAFKAGGPIQSLTNLVRYFGKEYRFFVYTGHQDLDGSLLEMKTNVWSDFEGKAQVFYADRHHQDKKTFLAILSYVQPDVVYINGVFNQSFAVKPLRYLAKTSFDGQLIIAPRGMLQQASLQVKAWKKKPFLLYYKWLLMQHMIKWHVTTEQEKQELGKVIPNPDTILIGNIPKILPEIRKQAFAKPLRLVTVALISSMKNHLLVLKALRKVKANVVWDIYGPVKDDAYWESCLAEMQKLPKHIQVNMHGGIAPSKVSEALADAYFYIQPSQSENFGHALFEALMNGKPLIISDQTPWRHLEEKQAGWGFSVTRVGEAFAFAVRSIGRYR